MPPLPADFLAGENRELLAPLRWLEPGSLPKGGPPEVDRRSIAEALAVANSAYGHRGAKRLAEALADPGTAVVVTGQQTGLFGGPLYTLTKAVSATLWAERLTAAGQPAVAVFWMATEDHDYREVARAGFPEASGLGITTVDLGDDPSPLRPVGMRAIGPGVADALARFTESGSGDRFALWAEQLSAWYKPDARFGEAFARLLAALLGERCPLLLDAMLPAVKEAERPWLERVVFGHEELVAAYAERDRRIAEAEYDLQVQPQAGSTPLFYLHGQERRRLGIAGDRVTLRGLDSFERGLDWLESALRENPAVVSPGVLARPAIQDAVLGSFLQVLGPGEMSYMPQAAPLYQHLGVDVPWITLRPQALVLGQSLIDKAESSGIALDDFVQPALDLDRLVGGDRGSELVSGPAGAGTDIAERLAKLEQEALSIDRNLAGPFAKTSQQIQRALTTFAGKIDKAAAEKNQVARRRAEAVRATCRPGGKLQERVVSTAYFPGKYGDGFVDSFFAQLDLDPRKLSVIRPE